MFKTAFSRHFEHVLWGMICCPLSIGFLVFWFIGQSAQHSLLASPQQGSTCLTSGMYDLGGPGDEAMHDLHGVIEMTGATHPPHVALVAQHHSL